MLLAAGFILILVVILVLVLILILVVLVLILIVHNIVLHIHSFGFPHNSVTKLSGFILWLENQTHY